MRTIPEDWYPGAIPSNVAVDPTAYLGSSYSFTRYRSTEAVGLRVGRGAMLGDATILDVGPHGRITIGDYAMVTAARIICDGEVAIEDYALVSWNVVVMDTYRMPAGGAQRRRSGVLPVRIARNAWVGFEACILPGVTVGEGAVVGARAVVVADVPPFAVVAGNPARVVRDARVVS